MQNTQSRDFDVAPGVAIFHLRLESLGTLHFFHHVLAGRMVPGDKHQLLLEVPACCIQGSIIVGETATDVAVARAVEISTVVSAYTGIRSPYLVWLVQHDPMLVSVA